MRKALSEKDRIQLAYHASRDDREYFIHGLSEELFVSIDLVTSLTNHHNPWLRYSPLEVAALNQHWELVNSILTDQIESQDSSIEENMRMVFSRTLIIAAFYNQMNIVSLLVNRADLNYIIRKKGNNEGRSALHFLVFHKQKSMVRILIRAGANPLLSTTDLLSPLEYAVQLARKEDSNYWELVNFLTVVSIQASSSTEMKNIYARTLFLATTNNQVHVVEHLLSLGADPNLMMVESGVLAGYTTLHMAHRKKNRAIALHLLAHGADATKKALDGTSFQSLTVDKELRNILQSKNINKKAKYAIKYKKHLLTSHVVTDTSFAHQFSNSASVIRESIFSFFGMSSSERIEESERKITSQSVQIKQLGEETKSQSDRIDLLQGMMFNQSQSRSIASDTDLFKGRDRRSHTHVSPKKTSQKTKSTQSG